jgi:hypothetical protein
MKNTGCSQSLPAEHCQKLPVRPTGQVVDDKMLKKREIEGDAVCALRVCCAMGSACSVSSIDILGPAIASHVEEQPLSHTVFSFYLSPSQLAALFSNFSMATLLPGDVVYKPMDASDGFLLVADDGGKIVLEEEMAGSPLASSRVNKENLSRPMVGAGDFFGEMGVLGPPEASRGHKAMNAGPGPVTLWHCSRSAYAIFLRVYVCVYVCMCVRYLVE